MTSINLAKEYQKPTVGEFAKMATLAAVNKSVNLKKLHALLGIGDRTFRNWIAKAEVNPDAKSSVPFWAFNMVHAMAYGKPYLKPIDIDWRRCISSEMIMTANNYTCPTNEVLKTLVGKGSITQLTRLELAKKIGSDSNWLSVQIRESILSFGTYSNILLLCGVPEKLLFTTQEKLDEHSKKQHHFEGFTLELVPECEDSPMIIKIENSAGFVIDLPSVAAFHFVPLESSEVNVVMVKMNNETPNPPELSFHLSNEELETLKKVSLLPVHG